MSHSVLGFSNDRAGTNHLPATSLLWNYFLIFEGGNGMGAFSQDGTILESTMETGIIEDTCIDSDGHGLADWEEEAIRITSDPATNPAIKRAIG